jgi:hypothetical protein
MIVEIIVLDLATRDLIHHLKIIIELPTLKFISNDFNIYMDLKFLYIEIYFLFRIFI